jgi:colanic acid biosynthesis glycosyl transferase WcaI
VIQMRVLILSQYFTPEIGATQSRIHAFASGLAERGHVVDVICEVPNHPQGIVHPGFRGRPMLRCRMGGFRVTYVWVYARRKKSFRTRLGFYGSYALMATVAGSLRPRPDVVLASSPPLPVAATGAAIAARHRVPWVMDVRDLWPAAAVAMGELSSPTALRVAELLERRLYRSATAITAVTEPFRKMIATKVSRPEKVSVLPNGTSRLWLDGAELEVDRESLRLPRGVFLWTYAGLIGRAQGLEAAIDAAATLDENFRLLVLGDGPSRSGLEERASVTAPRTVEFRGQVPPAQALRYLRASDALLVPLAADPVFQSFVPSKLFDFCAAGRPVVLSAAGEAQRLASPAGAALTVPPGEREALADAIRRLRDDGALRERLVTAGRRFSAQHLREPQVERLAQLLESVVGSKLVDRS